MQNNVLCRIIMNSLAYRNILVGILCEICKIAKQAIIDYNQEKNEMANGLKMSSSWVSVNRKEKRIALQFSQINVIRKINIIKLYPITAMGMPNYRTQSV